MKLNGRIRRMDFLMIESNIRFLSCMELIYTCISKLVVHLTIQKNYLLDSLPGGKQGALKQNSSFEHQKFLWIQEGTGKLCQNPVLLQQYRKCTKSMPVLLEKRCFLYQIYCKTLNFQGSYNDPVIENSMFWPQHHDIAFSSSLFIFTRLKFINLIISRIVSNDYQSWVRHEVA